MWSADGINKVIPLREELNDALGWLKAVGLIAVDNAIYKPMVHAKEIVEKCDEHSSHIFELWDALVEELEKIVLDAFEPETISEENFEKSYQQYHKEFRDVYKELKKKDP